MHLLIGTRGNKENVEKFIRELASKYMPFPFYNKKTGEATMVAQPIHVRPFQLWEIIFPKEQRDVVLTTIFPEKKEVLPDDPKFRWIYRWLLKFIPLIKIPEDWDSSKKLYVNHDAVETVGFGMKDDRMMDFVGRSDEQMKMIGLDPKEKYEYEGL